MSFDDPRITAFALDELEGAERAAMEAACEADPALRAEVESLRTLGAELRQELSAPAAGELGLEQRAAALHAATLHAATSNAAAQGGTVGAKTGVARRLWPWALAAAASFLIAFGVIGLMAPQVEKKARQSAHLLEPGTPGSGPELSPASGDGLLREVLETDEETSKLVGDAVGTDHYTEWKDVGLRGRATPGGQAVPQDEPAVVAAYEMSRRKPGSGKSLPTGPGGTVVITGRGGPAADPKLHRQPSSIPPSMREPHDPTPTTAPPTTAPPPSSTPPFGLPPAGPVNGAPAAAPAAKGRWARLRLPGREGYTHPGIDPFRRVTARAGHTSTFSVDVDTASYTNIRRLLRTGQLPHAAAVRVEEIVNFFDYGYAAPEAGAKEPFRTHIQIAQCPWNPKHRLARIALKGREVSAERRPAANLVFLVDVSGSMSDEDKLPLVRAGLESLAEQMRDEDRISIVTYSASANVVLSSAPGSERAAIIATIRSLRAGGSTNGAGGIQLAYAEAKKGFLREGVNRVILCTDGDFNVGISDTGGLVRLIQAQARTGVYLSVLGYGTGNLQDGKMEALSNKGNGNYAYIDSQVESRRVLVEELSGTLVTIAKDVKFQLWFNPKRVAGWRLLGYENRRLAARDFNDDSKDAGDIGAGHEVTALYEIIPTGAGVPGTVDPNPFLEGGAKAALAKDAPKPEPQALFIWRLRWKAPEGGASSLLEQNAFDKGLTFEQTDRQFQWATAAGAFGMLLRHSPHRGQTSWDLILELAGPAKGEDPKGRRAEFIELCKKARDLGAR